MVVWVWNGSFNLFGTTIIIIIIIIIIVVFFNKYSLFKTYQLWAYFIKNGIEEFRVQFLLTLFMLASEKSQLWIKAV